MKTLTNLEHFAFTNHFNKSLLKSRIAMMNRTKSSIGVVFNYGLFIGILWLCVAFTKPYRAEVAAKIVAKVPGIGNWMKDATDEKNKNRKKNKEEVFSGAIFPGNHPQNVKNVDNPSAGINTFNKKYIMYGLKNEVEVLITAKTSLSDIVEIQKELRQYGKELKVIQWLSDSSGRYLNKLVIEFTPFTGSKPHLITRGEESAFMPMKPFQIQVPLSNFVHKWGYGDCCVDPTLQALSREDDDLAKFEALNVETPPDAVARFKRNGGYFEPTHIFYEQSLWYEGNMADYQAISVVKNTSKPTLFVKEPFRKALFRLNGKKSTIEEIESLPPERFLKAEKYDVLDAFGKVGDTYFVIYTK